MPQEGQVWNPKIKAFVDQKLFDDAMRTKDPTAKDYKGVSPNYGGGLVDLEAEGIGSTAK